MIEGEAAPATRQPSPSTSPREPYALPLLAGHVTTIARVGGTSTCIKHRSKPNVTLVFPPNNAVKLLRDLEPEASRDVA
jgi:hypothetical protein